MLTNTERSVHIMQKVKRKRNKAVTFRLSENEYNELQKNIKESGLSQQSYIIAAIRGVTVTPSSVINLLKDISKTFADYEKQLRGLATNVNQLSHIANGQGILPTANALKCLAEQIRSYRKENTETWQLIRSLISQQKATER